MNTICRHVILELTLEVDVLDKEGSEKVEVWSR